ncbi:MAG: hypothetical protein HQL24_05085 [Candidatus Omnitrophica bacterium]|nr:hypothetical protein [Candidatus Omnitrophota bacterium]
MDPRLKHSGMTVWYEAGMTVWYEAGMTVWDEAGMTVWYEAEMKMWCESGMTAWCEAGLANHRALFFAQYFFIRRNICDIILPSLVLNHAPYPAK